MVSVVFDYDLKDDTLRQACESTRAKNGTVSALRNAMENTKPTYGTDYYNSHVLARRLWSAQLWVKDASKGGIDGKRRNYFLNCAEKDLEKFTTENSRGWHPECLTGARVRLIILANMAGREAKRIRG